MHWKTLLLLSFVFVFFGCEDTPKKDGPLLLKPGMIITESAVIQKDIYAFPGSSMLDQPVITISGNGIILDFNGAILDGGVNKTSPDLFSGIGIQIEKGSNVQLRNLTVKGYKVGLMATEVDSLNIYASDFSYNYRPRLKSTYEAEDTTDELSFENNEDDEWLRYGAGLYLKKCTNAVISKVTVTQGMNGILISGCTDSYIYNNTLQYNSGLGIGLYRSTRNLIMHNKADFNIRGYQHLQYNKGQGSAGILAFEQSSQNTIAYNSATHSGNGLYMWAGQSTLQTGEGGCNQNLVYGNDFNYASNNGIEVTFSAQNLLTNNKLIGCDYGIWGAYSYGLSIEGNTFKENRVSVAIEHGNQSLISGNSLYKNEIGIQLWERDKQPEDWPFTQKLDVSSRDYTIRHNTFFSTQKPLEISGTTKLSFDNNNFYDFKNLWEAKTPNKEIVFENNRIFQQSALGVAKVYITKNDFYAKSSFGSVPTAATWKGQAPNPIPGGMDTRLPKDQPQGRQYMLLNEWGPYSFTYPAMFLRDKRERQYVFALFGPVGNWKVVDGQGFAAINPKTGSFPNTLTAELDPTYSGKRSLVLEYIGEEFTDQFGKPVKKGAKIKLEYQED